MKNRFGIPPAELSRICRRDSRCVYCRKAMLFPYDVDNTRDSATIEHLNRKGPFHWPELQSEDIAMACGSCNSSRGTKELRDWFRGAYCTERNINEDTVAPVVQKYLARCGHKTKN